MNKKGISKIPSYKIIFLCILGLTATIVVATVVSELALGFLEHRTNALLPDRTVIEEGKDSSWIYLRIQTPGDTTSKLIKLQNLKP